MNVVIGILFVLFLIGLAVVYPFVGIPCLLFLVFYCYDAIKHDNKDNKERKPFYTNSVFLVIVGLICVIGIGNQINGEKEKETTETTESAELQEKYDFYDKSVSEMEVTIEKLTEKTTQPSTTVIPTTSPPTTASEITTEKPTETPTTSAPTTTAAPTTSKPTEAPTAQPPATTSTQTSKPTEPPTTGLTGYNTQSYDNGDKYFGNFENGIRSGQGTYEWSNGVIYKGEFVNGEPSGAGDYIYPTEAITEASVTAKSGGKGNAANFYTYDIPEQQNTADYVLNLSTKKFHYSYCPEVKKIKPSNYATIASRENAINQGYVPCKKCDP